MVAFIFFSKYPRLIKEINEGTDTHRYSCVRDVERRIVEELSQVDTDKIYYEANGISTDAVYEIAHSTAQKQSEG
jgi:hypothetical protein